ncbi:FIST C-terminal domain-containing protein [bacterium]|nr:FIST C-terminal domain-containing protein [bacterium]MBU1613880.1 FIST C-terminal domain-containing protein [bacterium]
MYLAKANSQEIVKTISQMNVADDDLVLIVLGEKNKPDILKMISGLNQSKVNFFGGIFPGVIYDDKRYEEGAVITVLPGLEPPHLIRGLSTGKIELPDCEKKFCDSDKKYTAIILIDGLTSNISLFLSNIFNRLGNSVNYFGGGAGSLSLKQEPCLFTKDGFFQDAAVVTFIKLQSCLGVRHGWEKIMGPIVATKTDKNIVVELNWENAFSVYQKTIEADSGKKLSRENFFSISKGYPFGMHKEGAEDVVRDPIAVQEKGELICVGEIPENTVLNILKGKRSSLISAAGQAADDCQEAKGKKIEKTLIADCISRVLFLEEDFDREVALVKERIASINKESILEGLLSLGEISSYGEGLLEFFNKTTVVGVLYE